MAFGLDDAINAGLQIVNKFIPDPAAAAQAEQELRASLQAWDSKQSDTNTAEASNPNLFVSGWRPAIGWVGAIGLLYQYLLRPVAVGAGWHDLQCSAWLACVLMKKRLGYTQNEWEL